MIIEPDIRSYDQLKQDWLHAYKVDFNNVDKNTDTEYHISILSEDTLLISFQDSRTTKDWFYNFNFFAKPYHNMKNLFFIHRGFLKKYKAVQQRIHKTIEEFKPKKLLLRGYSLGGALAQICHEDMWFNYPEINLETVVFGSPQPFSWFNAHVLKDRLKNVIRVESEKDIVTYLPSMFLGFWSYGKKIRIGKKALIGFPSGHYIYKEVF